MRIRIAKWTVVPVAMGTALLLIAASVATAAGPGTNDRPDAMAEIDRLLGLSAGKPSPAPSFPPAPDKVGVLDASLVFVFHPMMRDFVRVERNFLRPTPEAKTEGERRELLTRAWRQSQRVYNDASDARKKVMARFGELDQGRLQAYDAYQRDRNKLITEGSRKASVVPAELEKFEREHAEKIRKREEEYWKRIQELETGIGKLQVEVDRMNADVVGQTLLTPPELEARIDRMMGDIRDAIEKARERFRLSVVFNEGFLEKIPQAPRQDVRFEPHPAHLFAFENPYRQFLDGAGAKEPVPDVHGKSNSPKISQMLLGRYLQDRRETGRYFWSSRSNRLVVSGALDITQFVLTEVLSKYNMPKDKQAEILKFVESRSERF